MTRPRLLALAFDVLVLLGGALLTFATVPPTYQAEATLSMGASKPGWDPSGSPDWASVVREDQDLFHQSGAGAHGAELVDHGHLDLVVVVHNHNRHEAARLANQAAADLSAEAHKDPRVVDGWTLDPGIGFPAVTPPMKDRTPLALGGVVAFAVAVPIAVRARKAAREAPKVS